MKQSAKFVAKKITDDLFNLVDLQKEEPLDDESSAALLGSCVGMVNILIVQTARAGVVSREQLLSYAISNIVSGILRLEQAYQAVEQAEGAQA